jgi:DNA-binding FadR family transcriptional regulator
METVADDSERFAGPDLAFHQAVLRHTGNELIASLAGVVEMALLISFRLSDDSGGQRHAMPQHRMVLERIEARDDEGARAASMNLLNDAEKDVVRVLEQRRKRSARARKSGR